MKTIKNKFSKKLPRLAQGIGFVILGIILLAMPGMTVVGVSIAAGAVCLIAGIIRIARYVGTRDDSSGSVKDIVSGGGLLICAFLLLLHPKFLLSILPFFMGVCILIYGVTSFFTGGFLRGPFKIIGSVLSFIWGLSLIFNPFKGTTTIVSLIGFGCLAWGIILILSQTIYKNKKLLPTDTDGDGYREVDFTDVD
ncbi:MAG: hypothetical protein E7533_04540 [Ruminococcaceae bacterium]|nr:hypothetical protein [Oscillospiraceae bacterium]